ncbi:hypothetical protein DFJ58DRAFT_702712 [Suillus subalutaceus]|uniref:uncharacterized protein n=1 Tax=Suillus subalutaceus TaxID=48586 RepID=UPI001B85CFEE|nr:uncharacterized protein DFJ58DRAFT_702712 [Suillus subalutaceus]KAG1855696.1 hypothetical protein DFJ58DRAFT_702712 [Suillus subalutaceus]
MLRTWALFRSKKEIAALGNKARDGKLTLEDMAGGTFTISNGGVFGSLYGTPIINLPQSAVLGMHAIKDKPVVVNGQIVVRPIMVVALTCDHRLLDGREAVTLLVKVRDYIEDPRKMLLESSCIELSLPRLFYVLIYSICDVLHRTPGHNWTPSSKDEALIIRRKSTSYVPSFIDSLTLLYSLVFIVNVVNHNTANTWSELARSKPNLNH